MKDKEFIEGLFRKLSETQGGSDVIITNGKPPQFRVNNDLISIGNEVLTPEDTAGICQSLLRADQLERFQKEKEFDFSYFIEDVARFRINLYFQRGSAAMAVRIIPEDIPSMEQLNLPPIIKYFAERRQGLVLITGPVGSGKSTTIASMVDHINKLRPCHIVSIEDPIEYTHKHKLATIDQREVGTDTHSFAEALKRVLRQSMDVVVVGEIRDQKSAQAAMTLAETGHLTLATLHTKGTVDSANRLIDIFPSDKNYQIRVQLAASLAGVIWQQLLPRCDEEGLILACEILTTTPAVSALIRKGRTQEIYSLIQSGREHGMCTMEDAIKELVETGKVDESLLYQEIGQMSTHINKMEYEMIESGK
jgi:twitching motility protein PilT